MRWWWAFVPVTATACGLLLGDDDLSGASDGGFVDGRADSALDTSAATNTDASTEDVAADASTNDGSVNDVVATDAAESCQSLLLNGGFEDKASCDPWVCALDDGGIEISSTAHSGARSCEMCAGDQGLNFFSPLFNVAWQGGDTMTFRGWLRASDEKLFAVTVVPTIGDFTYQQQVYVQLSNEYQPFTMELDYPDDAGTRPNATLRFVGGGNGCMLVDDLTVCRRPRVAGSD